jgi:hypothetical protein
MEVWRVARYDAYTGVEKGSNPSAIQSTILQLRRMEDGWKVTARQVLGTEGPSRWQVTTPTAEGDAGTE